MTNGNKECSIWKLKNLMHQSRIAKLLHEMTSLRVTDTKKRVKKSVFRFLIFIEEDLTHFQFSVDVIWLILV